MPIQADAPAPYAPPATVLNFLDRYRNHGLQTPIDATVLTRAGVNDSLINRTLAALQILDFIDDDGEPTAQLELLRGAPEAEYQARLADHIRSVYSDVFNYVDPATASYTEIRDTFRSYNPRGQQERMVTLFTGLCVEAGIISEVPPKPASTRRSTGASRQPTNGARTTSRSAQKDPKPQARKLRAGLPTSIIGLIDSLPNAGEDWTQENRDSFVTAFGHILDFAYPIIKKEEQEEESQQPA